MAYVYIHKRKDNSQPFYVGVGGLLSFDNYQRANANNCKGLKNRSIFWKSIVNSYDFYVEIVLDNCSRKEAFDKEIELISKYGRRDIGTGILVNHTNGGEGRIGSSKFINKKCGAKNIGRKLSKEHKQKISIGNKGKILTEEDKIKKSLALKGKPKRYRNNTAKYVINVLTNERFDSCKKAAESISMKPCTLRAMLSGRNPNKTNFKYE